MVDGKGDILNILSISDIHLGHKRTSSESILDNLKVAIPNNQTMVNIDLIIVAGDVFDSLQQLPDNHIGPIQKWIFQLLVTCATWDIKLRVLEGTPSHDRKQSKQFMVLASMMTNPPDVKYFDNISIEHISDWDINLLYVPDEIHADPLDTADAVGILLKEHKLNTVDYAIMHGMFAYQVPAGVEIPNYDIDYYESIVNKYIFCGHVHQMSQVGKVIVNGSFDRLAFGEEETKGHWHVKSHRNSNKGDVLTFVENHNAAVYRSLDLTNCTVSQAEELVLAVITAIGYRGNVELKINHDPALVSLAKSFTAEHSSIRWKVKRVSTVTSSSTTEIELYKPMAINPDTIRGIISKRLHATGIDHVTVEQTLTKLDSVLCKER